MSTNSDPINHPPHYNAHPSGIECIQITEHMNFCLGNAIKYIRKALDALDRMSRGVDWCDQDEQARRWSAARRALTGGKEE